MGKKAKDIVIKGIIFSLIPAFCTYLSQAENMLDWLQKKNYIGTEINLEFVRQCAGILSIIFTFVFLTVPLIIVNLQSSSYKSQRDVLIKNNKEILQTTLKDQLYLDSCKLNIRVFVPYTSLRHKICKWFKIKTKNVYYIKNIEGLAEKDITDNLKFEVYPNKQGLVGVCYEQKAMLYDDDLENSNETNYNLTHYQIAKTNQLKFILVCPIFSENEEIIAIVSFDSCDKIKIKEDSKEIVRKIILNYTQSLYECIPDLFKAIGGIM